MKQRTLSFFLWALGFLFLVIAARVSIQTLDPTSPGETVRYPVSAVHYLLSINDYAHFTLEEAVAQASFIAVCEADDIGASQPLEHYDEGLAHEMRYGAEEGRISLSWEIEGHYAESSSSIYTANVINP